jgi:signal peptidase I
MRRNRKWIRSDAFQIAMLVVLMTIVRSSLADHYHVPTGSMEDSLVPGDRVLVDKTAYGLRVPLTTLDVYGSRSPNRGEIAVFDYPVDGTRLIKRIVAVGGDAVALEDGRLSINGEPLGSVAVERFGDREALLNLRDGGGPDIPCVSTIVEARGSSGADFRFRARRIPAGSATTSRRSRS